MIIRLLIPLNYIKIDFVSQFKNLILVKFKLFRAYFEDWQNVCERHGSHVGHKSRKPFTGFTMSNYDTGARLQILISSDLKPTCQVNQAPSTAYKVLGMLKNTIVRKDAKTSKKLYTCGL